MRLSFVLLLCWTGLTQAAGLLAADHLPDRIVSPLLWWAIDAGGNETATSPDAPDLTAALTQWLAQPPASLRALPEGGLRLGLLAITPDASGVMAPRILQPPLALDSVHDWPARQRYRQVALAAGAVLASGGDWQQTWLSDDLADEFKVVLPLPSSPMHLQQAGLILPLQQSPVDALTVRLTLHDPAGQLADRQFMQQASALAGALSLDLRPALADWLGQGVVPVRFQLGVRPLPQRDSERGRWSAWSAQTPASWRLSWQEVAHRASGREQLQRELAGLLTSPGQLPAADPGTLWQALRLLLDGQAPASEAFPPPADTDADCLPAGGLLLGVSPGLDALAPVLPDGLHGDAAPQAWRLVQEPEPWPQDAGVRHLAAAQLSSALTRWQDRRLAPPVRVAGWQPRLRAGVAIGWDLLGMQPIPGRQRWPGNLLVRPCRADETCADVLSPEARLDDGLRAHLASDLPVLDDADSPAGAPFASMTAAPAEPAASSSGSALWLDGGDTPGHVLWLSADGEFILLDAAHGQPYWRWLPARLLAAHARALQDVTASEPLPAPRLYLHETDSHTRQVHAAVMGELVALDLSEPARPRHLFRADLPAGWLGSLTLFAVNLPDGQRHPFLLAASAPGAETGLRLLDGMTGQLLWQADSHDAQSLFAGWHAPWAVLAEPGGGVRLYGMDVAGQVWRLPISRARPLQTGLLLRIASLPPGPLTSAWDQPLSLAWMRQQGALVPALAAVASRDAGSVEAALHAWLDLPTDSPRQLDALPSWPEGGSRPPEHVSGWRRAFETGERVMASPRWLRQQLVVGSSVRAAGSGCSPPTWRQRLQVLPWQRAQSGVPEAQARQAETDLPLPATPLLQEDGSLRLPGEGSVMLPASRAVGRERLGKLPLPRP